MVNKYWLNKLYFALAALWLCAAIPAVSAETVPKHLSGLHLAQLSSSDTQLNGKGWHLVRTPGPEKTGDTVSMMRTADLLNSDPDFAGMMLRCQDQSGPQIAFAVVTPFKPRSKIRITLDTGKAPASFDGEVLGPGSLVALPKEAASLIRILANSRTMNVSIEGITSTVKGVMPLDGIAQAATQLETSCPRQ